MAPKAQPDRELRFVAVNSQKLPASIDKTERSSVRAFVMREYIRQKSNPDWNFTPAKVTEHMSTHISRFRTIRPPSAAKTRKRKVPGARRRRVEEQGRPPRPLIPAPVEPDDSRSKASVPHDLDMLDAFGTLAVDLTDPDSQSLLQYYQTAFWANSYACNPEARWISVVLMDPAILHATLSLVAIHRRDCYAIDLSKVYFKHRGEAMKIVSRRLSSTNESLSDATIGAVALLSSSDNHFDWPSEAPTSHSEGLSHLIALRGGMESLHSNRHIQRVAGWADLLQSAMHGTELKLKMPVAVQATTTDDVKPGMTEDKPENLPKGLVLQELPAKLGSTLRQLRIVSSLKASLIDERNEELCRSFSNLLWKLEYSILDDPKEKRWEAASKDELLGSVVGSAVLIFSYLKLRDLAAPILYKRLSSRVQSHYSLLMASVESIPGDYWTESEVAILLWALYLAWRASRQDDEGQAWFINEIAQLCWRHGVLSDEDLQTKILSVIPQAHRMMDVPEEVWSRIEDVFWSRVLSRDDSIDFGHLQPAA